MFFSYFLKIWKLKYSQYIFKNSLTWIFFLSLRICIWIFWWEEYRKKLQYLLSKSQRENEYSPLSKYSLWFLDRIFFLSPLRCCLCLWRWYYCSDSFQHHIYPSKYAHIGSKHMKSFKITINNLDPSLLSSINSWYSSSFGI